MEWVGSFGVCKKDKCELELDKEIQFLGLVQVLFMVLLESLFFIKKIDYKMDLDYEGKISWACMGEKDK